MSDGWALIVEWLLSHLVDLQIAFLNGIATLFWWFSKLINQLVEFLITENLWELLLDSLLAATQASMPEILTSLVFSPTGLFYIALCLAGILLIIGYGDAQIAEPRQVIVWAVLIAVLFVSTTTGYDLIEFVEDGRRWVSGEILTIVAPEGDVSDLVAIPMRATPDEVADLAFVLPAQFTAEFFYEPEESDFNVEEGLLFDSWFTGQIILDLLLEEEAAQDARRAAALDGLLLSLLTLAPASLGAMFGFILAGIAASVLVLIIYFLCALPLGLFSFGKEIIQSIFKQYALMWLLTLTSTMLIALLMGTGDIFLPLNPGIATVVGYLPMLLVVGTAVWFLLKATWQAMLGTMGLVTATLRVALAGTAQNTELPDGGDVPLLGQFQKAQEAANNLAGLAVLGVAAAVTGGAGAVVPALAGGVFSRADGASARDAAMLARLTSDSPAAQTFAATAVTRQTLPAAAGIWLANRHNRQSDPVPLQAATNEELARSVFNPETTDEHLDRTALNRLARTAGSHDLGEAELNDLFHLVREGLQRAIREGIEAGQVIDADLSQHPRFHQLAPHTRQQLSHQAAELISNHQHQLWASAVLSPDQTSQPHLFRPLHNLAAAHNLNRQDLTGLFAVAQQAYMDEIATELPASAALQQQLAGNERYRHFSPVAQADLAQEALALFGQTPNVPGPTNHQSLAQTTLDPTQAPTGLDVAALSHIRDTAQAHNLANGHDLMTLFTKTQDGLAQARQEGKGKQEAVFDMLSRDPTFSQLPAVDRAGLARSATLVLQSVPPLTEEEGDAHA